MFRDGILPLTTLVGRWGYGMGLVTWRYLWSTTPLHRSELRDHRPHLPPDLPDGVPLDGVQHLGSGAGSIYHRQFRVRIADAAQDAAGLMHCIRDDFERLVPQEVVHVRASEEVRRRTLEVGDDLVVDMPGPWNGPVRVVSVDGTHLRFATLDGHLEAGQIEFRARDEDDLLVFEIEAWARPADRSVQLLYARLRLAKEIQLNMWVRFCLSAARAAGGRAVDGVEIRTVITPPA